MNFKWVGFGFGLRSFDVNLTRVIRLTNKLLSNWVQLTKSIQITHSINLLNFSPAKKLPIKCKTYKKWSDLKIRHKPNKKLADLAKEFIIHLSNRVNTNRTRNLYGSGLSWEVTNPFISDTKLTQPDVFARSNLHKYTFCVKDKLFQTISSVKCSLSWL